MTLILWPVLRWEQHCIVLSYCNSLLNNTKLISIQDCWVQAKARHVMACITKKPFRSWMHLSDELVYYLLLQILCRDIWFLCIYRNNHSSLMPWPLFFHWLTVIQHLNESLAQIPLIFHEETFNGIWSLQAEELFPKGIFYKKHRRINILLTLCSEVLCRNWGASVNFMILVWF